MTQMSTAPVRDIREQPRSSIRSYFTPLRLALSSMAGAAICAGYALIEPGPLTFLPCAILACLSFLLMAQTLKQEVQKRVTILTTLTTICQEVLNGEDTKRVQFAEKQSAPDALLAAQIVNALLDGYTYQRKDAQARRQELAYLQDQMEMLIYEMQPVLDGDLRARSKVVGKTLGHIATMCNALIEDTAQLIQWAQYMSDQIVQTAQSLMKQSLEIGQITEIFATQQEDTARTIETLLAFTLQMESALFSYSETLREDQMQSHETGKAIDEQHLVTELFQDRSRQIKLLEGLLQKTHATTLLIENNNKERHNADQLFQHVNGVVVQFARILSDLITLADNWHQAAENYILPTFTEGDGLFVETIPALTPS